MPQTYTPQNISTVAGILASKGWTDNQIAGVIGNMKVESSFDPNAYNNIGGPSGPLGGSHYGIIQWDASRQANLVDFANANGLDPRAVETQALFIHAEATNPAYGEVGNYNKFFAGSNDPANAANGFNAYVERSGEVRANPDGTFSVVKDPQFAQARADNAKAYAADPNNPKFNQAGVFNAVPPQLQKDGWTFGGTDEGGPFYKKEETYTKPDGTEGKREVSLQYEDGKWWKYDTESGNPIDSKGNVIDPATEPDKYKALMEEGSYTAPDGTKTEQATANDYGAPPPANGAGAASGLGGAAASAAGGMNIGGAGCLGAGATPAALTAAGGLMGQLGGIAQNALMSGALAALSGGGLQGVLGGMLGSAAGALGNSLGSALGGAAGAFAGQALGSALGGIVAGQNPLQALSSGAFGALSSMGGSILPALSGVMPDFIAQGAIQGLSGALGALASGKSPSAALHMALSGGLAGTIGGYVNNMTGNYALGATLGTVAAGAINGTLSGFGKNAQASGQINLMQFARNISTVAATASGNRLMVGAITEAMAIGFGNSTTGGVGAKTRNMQDAMTFSISTLGQNISAVATDFQAMGTWDASNLMRFMQPGHVATQIMSRGLGGYTGLQDALSNVGVPIAGLDNPIFDRLTQTVLNTITDTEVINTIKTAFSMTVDITNLGQLTNIQSMMPGSYKTMPVHNFRELGIQLSVIGIRGEGITCKKIGDSIAKIETPTDLSHIQQLNQPLPPEVGHQLLNVYGYGGGSLGEQTMADFMGTVAGYVHNDTIPVITSNSDFIFNHPDAATYKELIHKLKDAIEGKYTHLGTAGDTTADPPIPEDPGYIEVPNVGKFNTLDEVIFAFIPLIEAQQVALLHTTDPVLKKRIQQLTIAWNASCAQLVKESNNLKIHNIDLFNTVKPTPADAMMFVDSLENWGLQTGYGQPGHFIERVASTDFFGDCVKYCMRQSRNANALEGLGIDIEQYKLPQSQYLRDPEGFYTQLYTGNMPAQPANRKAAVYPKLASDVYMFSREQKLAELGYADVDLQNNQKDELYYDAHWMDVDDATLEDIGRRSVQTMLDRNVLISGNDMFIVGLDGSTSKFAEIKNNGLLLYNTEDTINTMMQIVNRLLYGDLITTKYENPFNTDQMIFGIIEMLAQVTNQNVEALLQTVTGGLIANGLLKQLLSKFSETRSLYDTKMDRNDPGPYGGLGRDTVA
jgi:Phage tail lysozyme